VNLKLKERFLTDKKGHKEAVVLDVRKYEELLEDLEDMAIIAERKDEPAIPLEELKRKLKK
jgi:hypothetical protein